MQVDLLAGNEVMFVRGLVASLSSKGIYNATDFINRVTNAAPPPPPAPGEPTLEVLGLMLEIQRLTQEVADLRETVRRTNPNYGKF